MALTCNLPHLPASGAPTRLTSLAQLGGFTFARLDEDYQQNKSRAVRPCLENLLSLLVQLRFATPSVDHTDSISAFYGLTIEGLTRERAFRGVTGEIGAT
jgi:hypothetical protein